MKKLILVITMSILLVVSVFTMELVQVNPNQENALTVSVLEAQEDYTVIEILLNHYVKSTVVINDQSYLLLALPGQGTTLEKGNPELPVLARSLMIPLQAKMHVQLLDYTFIEMTGNVAPSKGSLSRSVNPSDIPFEFSSLYETNAFFPENLVSLNDPYIMREIRGIAFRVTPFSVNPVQEIVRVYERLVIKVYAEGIDTIDVLNTRSSRITRDFVDLYTSHFINYDVVQSRYTVLEEDGSMLVICFPAFMEAMQPFVDWKNQKGIRTVMIPSTTAGTTPQQIKAYITNYWNENPELTFVQLVGDAQQIPPDTYSGFSSDPSYVMLVGNNNYPDLFISRFSAETVAHVQTQVERVIHYEKDIIDGDWFDKGMGIAYSGGGGQGWNGWSDIQQMNHIRDFLLGYNYTTVDQIYDPGASATTVTNALNQGRSIINYIGHGWQQGWDTTGFDNGNVNNLTNDWKLPHIISVACDNGIFHNSTCFAETWLRATNNTTGAPTGAISAYMAAISQPWAEPMPGQWHINQLLSQSAKHTIGGLYFNGASYGLDIYPNSGPLTIRTWHIFGDSSLMVRTATPTPFEVSSSEILFHGLTEFPVTVNYPGAKITLFNQDTKELITSAIADDLGEAVLVLEEPITELYNLILTVTAYNKITYVQEIMALPNNGAYIMFDSFDYAEGSNANYGTTADLNITVFNIGSEEAENIDVILTSNDPYIHIIQNQAVITYIASESFHTVQNAFTIKIAENIPDQYQVQFFMNASRADDEWKMNFRTKFNAPVLHWDEPFIIDTDGNNNGRLDPGETVQLHIPFVNTGHAPSSQGKVIISSNNPDAVILDNTRNTPIIDASSNGYAVFTVVISEDTEPGSRVNFGFFAEFSSQLIQSSFAFPIGLEIEDFETGDFDLYEWQHSAYPWYITTDEAYEGSYSLASANIANSFTSTLSLTKSMSSPGTISFYYKVSSLENQNYLQFFLNGTQLAQWSGEHDWAYVEFPVPAGNHQFRWVYRKGNIGAGGQDKAWIDYITFPLSGGSEFVGPVFHVTEDSFDFSSADIGETYTEFFYLLNFGNAVLSGTIEVPIGFNLYTSTGIITPNYTINPNNNIEYFLIFKPTEEIDYSGDIVFTANIEGFEEYRIPISANLISAGIGDTPELTTAVFGNYPNPFNPETTIRFSVAKTQNVQISIYNVRGQLVKNLLDEDLSPGNHEIIWYGTDNNGRNVSSGVYFYRFSTPENSQVNRMLLMK